MTTKKTSKDLQKKTSATKKGTTSAKAEQRINKSSTASVLEGIAKGAAGLVGGALAPVFGTGPLKTLWGIADKIDPPNVEEAEKKRKDPLNYPPPGFQYNLPPHQWSLPLRPIEVQPGKIVVREGKRTVLTDSTTVSNNHDTSTLHRFRRGVIWFWDNGGRISSVDAKGNVISAKQAQSDIDKDPKNKKAKGAKTASKAGENNYNYGFQFLWNPESISSSIQRNMDVTPSSADRFRSVSGAFPGQESYTFNIVLDRVNDFACLKSLVGKGALPSNPLANSTLAFPTTAIPADFYKYYKYSLYPCGEAELQKKLKDLLRYGTMADLEYLFRALNGDGSQDGKWKTLLGKETANIGFLSPTLLAFRFGPDSTSQPSFVGWITSMSINHSYFTEDMIPIRTTVSFSCDAFAGSTIV